MDIVSAHPTQTAHLEKVIEEMRTLGAPTIRAYNDDGDLWRAIEGTHRIEAAHRLGLMPIIEPVEWDDVITDHDLTDDLPASTTVGAILEHLGGSQIVTRFVDA